MFTLEQIEEIHRRLGQAEDVSDYVRSLGAIGVDRYDSFVADGHSEYYGHDTHRVVSGSFHDGLTIAESSDRDEFLAHLRRHERGETSYLEMSTGLAQSGVEKWSVDTAAMTMTFYDRAGDVLLTEKMG